MLERDRLDEALSLLGALLAERGQTVGLLIVGGGTLLLLGIVDRPTADVDVLGLASPAGYVKATALPDFLVTAVRDVADTLGLGQGWLNTGPADLMDLGLPPGLAGRVSVRDYGGLQIHLVARDDLIFFKLYAAVDQGERSKHFADLGALAPAPTQLLDAARWTRTHDPSPGFHGELLRILALLGVQVSADDL
jgi:hypothetical protein